MRFGRAFCFFGHHTLNRHKVRHNGSDFVGRCKHCATPMIRIGSKHWIVSPELSEETVR